MIFFDPIFTVIIPIIGAVAFIVLGAFVGMLISGIDRRLSARMQGRFGPPILQPWYDVKKLFAKEGVSVNNVEEFYVIVSLVLAVVSGAFFFAGQNFLLVLFVLTLSSVFLVVAAYTTRSPYAEIGAARETLQIMSYEPLVILLAITMFIAVGTFNVGFLSFEGTPLIAKIPFVFIALLYILTIKLRKSPFDISMSHHAHQEIVRGLTTEMSGPTLAKVEIMHWYETVLFMGWVGMFFVFNAWWSWLLAIAVIIVVYLLEILIDNSFARMKWQFTLWSSWVVTFVLCGINILLLFNGSL